MRLIAGVNITGLYLHVYSKTKTRTYWLDFGFYIYSELYPLIQISTTRKALNDNETN